MNGTEAVNIRQMTISEIKKLIEQTPTEDYPALVKTLYADPRTGVQKAALALNKKYDAIIMENRRIEAIKNIEEGYRRKGYKLIAGCDEAGRGPLCGPVVAAVVILPEDSAIMGVKDSKKLPESKREELYKIITSQALGWAAGVVGSDTIDKINILNATKLAVKRALAKLPLTPDIILTDALIINHPIEQKAFIRGDMNLYSIAAASIIAKVTRDRMMYEYDKIYPEYNFASNKGYGTYEHIKAISEYGPTAIHRRTFLTPENLRIPQRIIGNIYEDKACAMLVNANHKIIMRNYRGGGGEIDIISEDEDQIVFTEVKQRANDTFGTAESYVDKKKKNRIRSAASAFIAQKGMISQVRFDIIAFDAKGDNNYTVRHIKNAF